MTTQPFRMIRRIALRPRWIVRLAPLAIMMSLALFAAADAAASGGEGAHETPKINHLDMGYGHKNVHGQPLKAGDTPMPAPLILALINFGLLVTLVVWKGGPPIKQYLSQRHHAIKDALEESGRLRREAMERLDDYTRRISGVEQEVDKLITEIRASAEDEKKRIIAEAEVEADAMKRDAEQRIAAEFARARLALEREVAILAAAAAEQILKKTITAVDHQRLVDGFIGDLGTQGTTAPRGELF